LFNRESHAGQERLPSAALFLPMCFSLRYLSIAKSFAGEPATGCGALPLSYAYRFAAVDGGIRTRDLPINSRSNPCLHHRQNASFLSLRSKPPHRNLDNIFILALVAGGSARKPASPLRRRFW